MTNESPKAAETAPEPPKGPDVSLLFQDGVELPPELASLADHRDSLRTYIDTRVGEAATQAQQSAVQQLEERQRQQREREQSRAKVQEDIDWASRIEDDLFSTDEAKKQAAVAARDADKSRYSRAMSAKFETAETQVYSRNVSTFLETVFADAVKADGGQALVDAMTPELIAQHGGNPVRAAFAVAKAAGDAEGYARGLEAGKQEATVNDGASGQQSMTPPRGGGGKTALTEGVKLGAPGSTQELRRRFAGSRN